MNPDDIRAFVKRDWVLIERLEEAQRHTLTYVRLLDTMAHFPCACSTMDVTNERLGFFTPPRTL